MRFRAYLFLAAVVCLPLLAWAAEPNGVDASKLPPPAPRKVDFAKDVQPILAGSCHGCHGEKKQKADLRFDVKASALRPEVIVVGKSAQSPLIHRVAGLNEDERMPPTGKPLTSEQVSILRAWIDQGAPWPDEGRARDEHWSYRPLVSPPVPETRNPKPETRNPIDAFILAKLEEKGLSQSPPADKRTLIRRVTFDLSGLPPTPEQVEAFLHDPSADAYEKLVERLLASPAYGERWARHWMDVVHYAETHGHDQDAPREHAWPYRDYLIRSFNADKPYAQFVEEQIAGDVLFPNDSQALIATGLLAAGPWDESSQKDIRDDTIDKKAAQNIDRDDMVTTVMGTFVSTTIHCARCHDHKFDPISQKEYYGLQAVFAGVDRANRSYDTDPQVGRRRKELQRELAALQAEERRLTGQMPESEAFMRVKVAALLQGGSLLTQLSGEGVGSAPAAPGRVMALALACAAGSHALALLGPAVAQWLLAPQVQTEVAIWERERSRDVWAPLAPATFHSSGGSEGVKLPDHSIRFSGNRPETDVYTITAETDLRSLTGVRLEVLADDSLPHRGPGRQDNGNLHLSEFTVFTSPKGEPEVKRPIVLKNAKADFNQAGWTIAHALDGNPKTAWGIYPEVGKSHQAVFEFAEPLNLDSSTTLTLVLEQLHGGGHLIGRPRLSVTQAANPSKMAPLPEPIAQLLCVPTDKRSDSQKAELALHVLEEKISARIASLPPQQIVYAATAEFTPVGSFKPAQGCRPVHVLRRGDIRNALEAASPGGLSCVVGSEPRFNLPNPDDEGARRAALAKWISDPRNVLTWRSIVNRIWHYHFGRGIAATLNDLGKMGTPPTHPELLEWLAVWFRDRGGSLKDLHRLIVTSSTYMQSSKHRADYGKLDGDNQYLWRMNRTRLDAESVRDSVLAAGNKLDRTMYGPSVKQFIQTPGIHVTPNVDYMGFDPDHRNNFRRAVYRFVFRTLPDPFLDTLDCPDASQFIPARSSSVTPLQALGLLHDKFIVRQSEYFASRLEQMSHNRLSQIRLAYEMTLCRPPTDEETEALAAYADKHGLANACRVLFNCNEFVFVP
jgi:Protein of unknown function (DUF1549)/Protein of unknown function (DUF1553)/Planctomycete cytochrome C